MTEQYEQMGRMPLITVHAELTKMGFLPPHLVAIDGKLWEGVSGIEVIAGHRLPGANPPQAVPQMVKLMVAWPIQFVAEKDNRPRGGIAVVQGKDTAGKVLDMRRPGPKQ